MNGNHTRMWLSVVAALSLTGVLRAQESSPVVASLVVPDTKILPGMPFDMWIDLTNTSDTEVAVGLLPTLIVNTPVEGAFEIATESSHYVFASVARSGGLPARVLRVQPHQRDTLPIPVGAQLATAEFLDDYRLQGPGRYTLAVRLTQFPQVVGGPGGPVIYVDAVTTSPVTIERAVQSTADETVWEAMLQLTAGRWSRPQLGVSSTSATSLDSKEGRARWAMWQDIIQHHRDSNYFPYAVLAESGTGDAYLKLLTAAASRYPNSPVIELIYADIWRLVAGACGGNDHPLSRLCDRAWSRIQSSVRPTTRLRVFGPANRDAACPPEYDCK